jgi:hypothetical protein
MTRVFVGGARLRLDPARSIGKGGEADVFDIGDGRALKLFKTPDHPDYAGNPDEQCAAAERIATHQRKLREFPRGLPPAVIVPLEMALDRRGAIVGYVMRLLEGAAPLSAFGEPGYAVRGGTPAAVIEALGALHGILAAVHRAGVVVGDLNAENVLVVAGAPFLIDADSFQFGPFPCRVFTERFVDPLLCDAAATHPVLVRPYSTDSDWYAFAVLVMLGLLWVGPYGGLYRPRDASRQIPHAARPLRRITVFHPDVRYPRPARPLGALPDDLLEELRLVCERDRRGPFPRALLEGLRFTRCLACGAEHARAVCPACRPAAAAAVREHLVVSRGLTARRVFRTPGVILGATFEAGGLCWLYHEGGEVRREDGGAVLAGALDPQLSFSLAGPVTFVGRGATVCGIRAGAVLSRLVTDGHDGHPAFAVTASARYWATGGQLLRDGRLGPEVIGSVLAGHTVFWAGEEFGVGLSRAGRLSLGFVFDATRPGLQDGLSLGPLPGRLTRTACVFGRGCAFLFLALESAGRTVHRCLVLTPAGRTIASAEAEEGDGSWLGALGGAAAVGEALIAPTPRGLVRVEVTGDRLAVVRSFPATEPFVHEGCRLVIGGGALYVIDRHEIHELRVGGEPD